jgi:hypothetical protein
MKIIITDLTRFANKDIVCIAGINPKTNECIRPMPYIERASCEKLNILPGAIIEGDFTPCTCTKRNAAKLRVVMSESNLIDIHDTKSQGEKGDFSQDLKLDAPIPCI